MVEVMHGDAFSRSKELKNNSINCIVTSPPYFRLRDYGHKNQIGIESTPTDFVNRLCDLFDILKPKLTEGGTLFVNLGDSYSGSNSISTKGRRGFYKDEKDKILKKNNCLAKRKSLIAIPAMFQVEMIKRGWICRNKIIWNKTNVMPESVKDRFTNDYEEVFFFTKNQKYDFQKQYEPYSEKTLTSFKNGVMPNSHKYLEAGTSKTGMREGREWIAAVSEKGRNMRTVWKIGTTGIKQAHFSTFPEELVKRCIKAGCPADGIVLDPFLGSGTTCKVAEDLGFNSIGIELVEKNIEIIKERIKNLNVIKEVKDI